MPRSITILTTEGNGEAWREDADSPWEISVPNGADRLYGDKAELKVYLENMLGTDFKGLGDDKSTPRKTNIWDEGHPYD
jgi:hypothetical protein